MSQQQHTQEPWRANDAQADIDGPNGEPVAVCYCNDESGDDAKENARRIVACVNACAGISTANLEENIPIKELASRYNEALQQRDTLLAALKKLSGMKLNMIADGIVDKAIAEVGKGGAA